jgi:Fe-S-cluster-containing dehydrogenase component
MDACPIGAIQFNSSKNVVEKCTLCIHRIKEGLKPSCTLVCPTKALIFGDISEGGEIKQKRYAKKVMYGILEI